MRRYRSGTRWCVWRWTDVVLGGLLYLRRLHLIQTPWFSVMLHWIVRPDPQLDMHDHPVSFASIPLRGWYIEEEPASPPGRRWLWDDDGERVRHHMCRWRPNLMRSGHRHRIVSVSPGGCLTLVFAGPRTRTWGFHTRDGWVDWRRYDQHTHGI